MIEEIRKAANALHLDIFGALHKGADTVLLLGPLEPEFWAAFSASAEAQDGNEDPLDRWSKRIIAEIADQFDGTAQFPSDGPPYPPFISWARMREMLRPRPVPPYWRVISPSAWLN